jgi:UDP-2-acetamido-2-deoxy-ribo-hexuluronate aminotransferase
MLDIPTAVHYPMPLHLQKCFEYLGYKNGDFPISENISKEIMSLPMSPYLEKNDQDIIVKELL